MVTITPETTYEEAARLMHKHKFSGLPVVDNAGNLAGMLSEKDLFRAIYPDYGNYMAESEIHHDLEASEDKIQEVRTQPVEKFMTRKVITIRPDSPVLAAGGLMLAKHIHRLPVVDNDKVVGIVSREDIYRAILKKRLKLRRWL